MNLPQNQQEFLMYLWNEKKEVANLRDSMAKDMGEKRITLFSERKAFFQNLVIASVTLLGLVSAFSAITGKTTINNYYFITGVGLHIFLICFVSVYLREIIDLDMEGLSKTQDNLSEVVKDKISLVEKFILQLTNTTFDFRAKFREFVTELQEIPSIQGLVKENEKLDKDRKDRLDNKTHLDFNGEIVVFSFVSGTILIFLSILGLSIPNLYLELGVLFLFFIIFTDFLGKISKPLFKVLTFVTKKNILPKSKSKS